MKKTNLPLAPGCPFGGALIQPARRDQELPSEQRRTWLYGPKMNSFNGGKLLPAGSLAR